jgi:exonuclease VII small subunit
VLRQLSGLYREGTLIRDALAKAEEKAQRERPALEQRLASIRAEINRAEQALERYLDAFERGKLAAERCDERLSRLHARLGDLRAQQAELSTSTPDEGTQAPTAADLAAIADQLDHLVAEAEPQQAKALLRLLIAELKVNGAHAHPPHLPRHHAHGLRNVRKSGGGGNRTRARFHPDCRDSANTRPRASPATHRESGLVSKLAGVRFLHKR